MEQIEEFCSQAVSLEAKIEGLITVIDGLVDSMEASPDSVPSLHTRFENAVSEAEGLIFDLSVAAGTLRSLSRAAGQQLHRPHEQALQSLQASLRRSVGRGRARVSMVACDGAAASVLRDHGAIQGVSRSMMESVEQATAIASDLSNQNNKIRNTTAKAGVLEDSAMPALRRLIQRIELAQNRDTIIVGCVVGVMMLLILFFKIL